MSLAAWRRAKAKLMKEIEEENDREAERVLNMSEKEVWAQAVKEYGSEEAAQRAAEMTRRTIMEAVQKYSPTKH